LNNAFFDLTSTLNRERRDFEQKNARMNQSIKMSSCITRASAAAESRSETLQNRSVAPSTNEAVNEAANEEPNEAKNEVAREDAVKDTRSEITRANLIDIIAEQRSMLQRRNELMQTTLAARRKKTEVFAMVDPAYYCGGAPQLDRFSNQLRMNFNSHEHLFLRGDADRVHYAI